MINKYKSKKKDKKPVSPEDIIRILSKSSLRLITQRECHEILRILNDWNKPVDTRDINHEIRRRGLCSNNDVRHYSSYRLTKMVEIKIVLKIRENGKTKYKLNGRLKPIKFIGLKPIYPWHLITNLEDQIYLFRNYALDSKNEKLINLLIQSLSELELKLSKFLPFLQDDVKRIEDTTSIICELNSMYNEFKRTNMIPDNEFWFYDKFRTSMRKIKQIKILNEKLLQECKEDPIK